MAAWTADAALTLGRNGAAEQLFQQVLQRFPSALRILGIRLPAKVMAATEPESQATAERLLGSQRLRPELGLGFVARVTGKGATLRVCLEGVEGADMLAPTPCPRPRPGDAMAPRPSPRTPRLG